MAATPYLGFESLHPLLDAAGRNGTGVLVVGACAALLDAHLRSDP